MRVVTTGSRRVVTTRLAQWIDVDDWRSVRRELRQCHFGGCLLQSNEIDWGKTDVCCPLIGRVSPGVAPAGFQEMGPA
jgi:hypothetical protein